MAQDWTTTAMSGDPFTLFDAWFAAASDAEPEDPNAMAVATVDAEGRPSCRIVLLKAHDRRGFVFYTNTESRKGRELHVHPSAAVLFHWKSLKRQIRIEGAVAPVSDAEADAYFASRGHRSKLGAHASLQSRLLADRETLERRVAELEALHDGDDVPRPAHWSGYRVSPRAMEFWQDRPDRLHERLVFELDAASGDASPETGPWRSFRLYP